MMPPDSAAGAARTIRRWLPVYLSAGLIILACVVVLALRGRNVPPTATATATMRTLALPAHAVTATATTRVEVQASVSASPLATTPPQKAATPAASKATVATPTRAATLQGQTEADATAETWTARSQLVFGSKSGELVHRPDDFIIPTLGTELDLSDFIAEVRFMNPYAATEGTWSYGLGFRETGRNDQYRLSIDSTRQWTLRLVIGEGRPSILIGSGTLENLNVGSGEQNTLALFVDDGSALLFVNGTYIATLDVSASQARGDVWIATGMYVDQQMAGAVTRYTDFIVRSLP